MRKSPLALDLTLFEENLQKIQQRAAELSPDKTEVPRIVAVTKYLSRPDARRLLDAGYSPLGENRSDELEDKTDPGQDPGDWHFVGRLQRNKIRSVVPRISMLHSLDSEKLARSIDSWIDDHLNSPLSVLVQINIAGESRKAGLDPLDAEDTILSWVDQFSCLRFEGLMTMAPDWPAQECRPIFRTLRKLRSSIQDRLPAENAERFRHLSMGMSGDWQVAAEEGATLLRIGTALYLEGQEDS
ncbi:MAG: YggS family pyridoxal phosphate-dependent enzyme [Planctomycetota bacterium]|nr:YggS family pyridoxal phosphate-dependent enzyme [Planctomycetota bacterium]